MEGERSGKKERTPEYVGRPDGRREGVEHECGDDRAGFPTRGGCTMCEGAVFRGEDFGRVTLRYRPPQRQSDAKETKVEYLRMSYCNVRGTVSGYQGRKRGQVDSRVGAKVEEELHRGWG